MAGFFRRIGKRLRTVADDLLPMSPGQREAREWTAESGEEQSARRKVRLRLHLLEKRGKGGYR